MKEVIGTLDDIITGMQPGEARDLLIRARAIIAKDDIVRFVPGSGWFFNRDGIAMGPFPIRDQAVSSYEAYKASLGVVRP